MAKQAVLSAEAKVKEDGSVDEPTDKLADKDLVIDAEITPYKSNSTVRPVGSDTTPRIYQCGQ